MHVGLNLVFLVPGETGGIETYARKLIPAFATAAPDLRLTAFLSREAAEDTSGPWAAIPSVVVPVCARRRSEWVRGEQQLLPPLARREGVELVHSLANTAPLWGRFRKVVTVMDMIHRVYPEAHLALRSKAIGLLVPLVARRADRIIVPSSSTRDDVIRFLGVAAGKIDLVPLAVSAPERRPTDVGAVRERLGVGRRPVVLAVSAKRPHKNLPRLLDALSTLPSERRPALLLPGYATSWENDLRSRARELEIEDDVRFLGWVSDEQLDDLYAVASCFVFPSLYEGFGLPVLEAMARGVPVACADRASLPEVAGGAALLFDPEDTAAIAAAIELLVYDTAEADRRRAAGLVRVAGLTWEETARRTVEVYSRTIVSS